MSKRVCQRCPVCNEFFTDEVKLTTHVNTHFEDESKDKQLVNLSQMENCLLVKEHGAQKIFYNDLLLAQIVQEEENTEIRKKCRNDFSMALEHQKYENIAQEKEDFKKLQTMYGMNSTTGFVKQFDAKMSKNVGRSLSVGDYYKKKSNMFSSLMEGVDTLETATKGVIKNLYDQYVKGVAGVKRFSLCCELTHFGISIADRGWGCGYRNLQMLISSLLEHDCYKNKLKQVMSDIPSIPKLQALIENAWDEGYDLAGKEQLGGKLQGTRKWIGTTEVCAFLRSIKLRAQIIDFHRAVGAENTHVLMLEWISNYFQQGSKLPLYLQHQGHSRICIGIEEHEKKENYLLLLDPSTCVKQMHKVLFNLQTKTNAIKHFRKSIKQLKQSEFQILYIDGIIELPSEIQDSKFLTSLRIP